MCIRDRFLHSQSEYPANIVNLYKDELGNDATPSGNAWRAEYASVSYTHLDVYKRQGPACAWVAGCGA